LSMALLNADGSYGNLMKFRFDWRSIDKNQI